MPRVIEKISRRLDIPWISAWGFLPASPGSPSPLGNSDRPGISSWFQTRLSCTRCSPPMYLFPRLFWQCGPVFSVYSCQDKQLETMKVSGLSAQLFWPSTMPHFWLPGSRRDGVINFYAYHCQDHLLIRGGRLEMSPCKLSQSLHLGAWLAILHSAWHGNKHRVLKGSNSPGWWTGGIGPINCSL